MIKSPTRRKRLLWIVAIAVAVVATAWGVIRAFNDNMVFFYTPTQVLAGEAPSGRSVRIGGMVETGSVQREGLTISFRMTDLKHSVPVSYTGVLPDLFREGKGAVAQGELKSGVFSASEILAKHDENYMPPKLGKDSK
jgi:cytochrome c-type biogenesis protein CcmE